MPTSTPGLRAPLLRASSSALAATALLCGPASAQDPAGHVPDLVGQFVALNSRADALGLNISTTPDPSSCKHYQGITRVNGPDGTPFLIVTRSGNTPPIGYVPDGWFCDDSPGETGHGNLVVFKMGSRDKNGERLRSNRYEAGKHTDDTAPDARDVATIFYTTTEFGLVFRDGTPEQPAARVYGHPGGMQLVDDVLAVALETPYSSQSPESLVLFLDVSDPEAPGLLSRYAPVNVNGVPVSAAGTMGVARMPDGHFLMAITGGAKNPVINFFRSSSTDLKDPELDWTAIDMWIANVNREILEGLCESTLPGSIVGPGTYCLSPDEVYLQQNWPDGGQYFTHQTLQFLRDANGTLYLAGARGRFLSDDTDIDLYRVSCDAGPNCESGEVRLRRTVSRAMEPHPVAGGDKLVSFAAATGFYVSPSGELILYGAEHDNDGPAGSVKAGEWRNRNVVRADSPTLKPTATIKSPGTVDEGSVAAFTGTASGPITKAFLQLFHDTGFGSYNLIADYADRNLDDIGNLYIFELRPLPLQIPPYLQHSDKARSWIWHAPAGCSIRALDRVGEPPVIDETRTVTQQPGSEPVIVPESDLTQVLNDGGTDDIDQEVDGIEFLPDCDDYYSTPFALSWDLDGNGDFADASGSPVNFSAATLDGPTQVLVRAKSQSPLGGAEGTADAIINVLNVAPQITQFELRDSLGLRIGIDVPFAILGLPLTASGSFSDPGIPDRQTATLDWGDGIVEASSSFDAFEDAFGGRTGSFSRKRQYAAAGDYQLQLDLSDDDGGVATLHATASILSPAEAVAEIVAGLEELIATTTDPAVRKALQRAVQRLQGSVQDLSSNGGTAKLNDKLLQSAMQKLRQAIGYLEEARAAGADVALQIALLQQVLASLAAS